MPSVHTFKGSSRDWRQVTNPASGVPFAVDIQVDTSHLRLPGTPEYSIVLDGVGEPDWAVGVTSVMHVSPRGFIVRVRRPNNAELTVQQANQGQWIIRYVGTVYVPADREYMVTGRGVTEPTNWVRYDPSGIYVDVDTSHARFPGTPTYVSALHGNATRWDTTGGSSIYNPTATGFRVYVRRSNGAGLTTQMAQNYGWYIGWIGQYL